MLAILLLSTAFRNRFESQPLFTHEPRDLFGADDQCLDIRNCRTIQDIIWSCLATVFACTWVAVHPNLPGPKDSGWITLKRQATTVIYALLAPEFMAWWAMRQRIAASSLAHHFNEKFFPNAVKSRKGVCGWAREWIHGSCENDHPGAWTLTHGFFLQMGGFVLQQHGKPVSVLTFKRLVSLIEAGDIDIPMITESEILDKSKGEFFTKLFVVVQTTWFVIQCITRWLTGLAVTELEVVALAFAILNIVTYSLWWQKPQNVRVGITVGVNATNIVPPQTLTCRSCGNRLGSVISLPLARPSSEHEERLSAIIDRQQKHSVKPGRSWFRKRMQWNWWAAGGGGWLRWTKFIFLEMPVTLLRGLLRPLYKMAGDVDIDVEAGSIRIPMFYAHNLGSRILFVSIAFLFGGLHLISWSSEFPSKIEMWLWRSCALFVTTEPAVLLLYRRFWTHELNSIADILVLISLTLYCCARLILIVLCWTAFRALPPSAYRSVQWAVFFPHV